MRYDAILLYADGNDKTASEYHLPPEPLADPTYDRSVTVRRHPTPAVRHRREASPLQEDGSDSDSKDDCGECLPYILVTGVETFDSNFDDSDDELLEDEWPVEYTNLHRSR